MVKLCYRCSTPLIRKEEATDEQSEKELYRSLEHIIPDGIGGKLTSNELLCKACNSTLGHDLDSHLCNSIPFRGFLPFKMDKSNKARSTVGKNKDGLEVRIDTKGKVTLPKPQVFLTADKKRILRVHHYSSDLNALKGFLRKYLYDNPQIEQGLDEIIENYIFKKGEPDGELFFDDYEIGGRKFFRAIAKIAVGFAIHHGISTVTIENSIRYVVGDPFEFIPIRMYYPLPTARPYKIPVDSKEISHVLLLKGDPLKRLLYCYVELFNSLCYVVVLNDDYRGRKIDFVYGIEVIGGKELQNPQIELNLFRNPLQFLPNTNPGYHYNQMEITARNTRIINIYNSF